MSLPPRNADCHPDRRHEAKGLCRNCYRRESAKLQYRKDPEKFRARQREYHLKSPEKRAERFRRWKDKHLESARASSRDRKREERKNKPEKVRQKQRTWYANNDVSRIYAYAKNSAKIRQVEFSIDKEDIQIPELCPIFGIPLIRVGGARTDNTPSIDRIDPSKGYVKGNVWIISWLANRIKTNATPSQLRRIADAIELKLRGEL
jgi:hypothetical protein